MSQAKRIKTHYQEEEHLNINNIEATTTTTIATRRMTPISPIVTKDFPSEESVTTRKRSLLPLPSLSDNHLDSFDMATSVMVQFQTREGDRTGPNLSIPLTITPAQLSLLINNLLTNDESQPYSFFLEEEEIVDTLRNSLAEQKISLENVVPITYTPQSLFRVRAVTRCSSSIPAHSAAVLNLSFSPDSSLLASCSGDGTLRIVDPLTGTPIHSCKHKDWVLCVVWSPNGRLISSGSKDGEVKVWDAKTGHLVGKVLKGHKKWITSLAFEPLHLNVDCSRLVSVSKDCDARVWDLKTRSCLFVLSGHTAGITSVKWGGQNTIYTGSQDRTIKVWETKTGKLIRTLEGHAHWVNSIALNTDYAIRTGATDPFKITPPASTETSTESLTPPLDLVSIALSRYNSLLGVGGVEYLVSASEDFTLILWEPLKSKKHICRMTGHQQLINQVTFSPNGQYIASASYDKNVKVWNGTTGKFLFNCRAHVQAVYMTAWSADSRLLLSSSKDSTIKVWDMNKRKMAFDLPGHADEVYAVDWSPDGENVASGGKDTVIKLWKR